MEAPLVKKVEKKRELFGDVWQEVAVFALLVSGITAQKSDIHPQWGPAESDQPLTETQVIKTYRDAGLPIRSAMRLAGYTEAEITVIEEEIAEERQNSEDLAAIYLNQARDREVE